LKKLDQHGDNNALQSSEVQEDRAGDTRNYNLNLKELIGVFAKYSTADQDFINAMHKIREHGNTAAHRSSDGGAKLIQKECEVVVCDYRSEKEKYEINQSRSREDDPPSSTTETDQRKSANEAGSSPPDQPENKNAGDKLISGTTRNAALRTLISQPQRTTAPAKPQKEKKEEKEEKISIHSTLTWLGREEGIFRKQHTQEKHILTIPYGSKRATLSTILCSKPVPLVSEEQQI